MPKRSNTDEAGPPKKKRAEGASLDSVTIADMLAQKRGRRHNVVTLEHNNTVADALQVLSKENILSAPVVSGVSVEDHDDGCFMGIITVLDLVKALVDDALEKDLNMLSEEDWSAMLDKCEAFSKRKLITVLDSASPDVGFVSRFNLNTSLRSAIKEGFQTDSEKAPIHRLALFNERGTITAIISQSDVVRYFARNPALVGAQRGSSIDDIGLVKGKVVTIESFKAVALAFRAMNDAHVSAIGVTDEDGRLVGVLSASDLRGITHGEFPYFSMTVCDFLTHVKASLSPPVVVCPTTTLGECVQVTARARVHRVFVVDDEGKPVGVVSLGDILRASVA